MCLQSVDNKEKPQWRQGQSSAWLPILLPISIATWASSSRTITTLASLTRSSSPSPPRSSTGCWRTPVIEEGRGGRRRLIIILWWRLCVVRDEMRWCCVRSGQRGMQEAESQETNSEEQRLRRQLSPQERQRGGRSAGRENGTGGRYLWWEISVPMY